MVNLPVREMVLYKHGVGFFVRQGAVTGERVQLTFRQDEINDVLKSLAVFDQAGGQVLGIHYQTPMDIHQRLASSSIHLSEAQSLRDLVRDLRGRDCELSFEVVAGSLETLKGRIIGIDQKPDYSQNISLNDVSNTTVSMLTPQGIRVFPFEALRAITIHDEQSAHDLSYFLDTSMAEDERRVVTVRLSSGEHDLAVYYVAPSPTWRVSYRLVAESEAESTKGTALLQGWGLFDNRLEEDLEDVRLTLVAGQPISFIYELYASRIPQRPTVQDESRIAPGPIEFAGGAFGRRLESLRAEADDADSVEELANQIRSRIGEAESHYAAPAAPRMAKMAMAQAAPVQSETKDAGETFQYVVTAPVSIKRGESALVPIIGAEIQYERELLYNRSKFQNHPIASLRFMNQTGLTLERGPVTVVEDGDYKGEAVIAFTKENNQIYVPYAVELGIKVTERQHSHQAIYAIHLKDRALLEQSYQHQEFTYIIENNTKKAQVVTLEEPALRASFELYETRAADVETANERRWRVPVPANGKAEFVRKERMLTTQRREIRQLDYRTLERYLENRWLDQAVYQELKAILDLYASIQKAQKFIAKYQNDRNQIYQQQEQLRANLGALQATGQEANLRNRILKQLETTQDRLDSIEREISEAETLMQNAEQKIESALSTLGQ